MQRASDIKRAGHWDAGATVDTVMLDGDERQRRRMTLTGQNGTQVLLDRPHATMLRDGDGLVLEDGSIVRVIAKPEPLLDITARDAHHLARLAWHLGNRHIAVQIEGEALRIRRDHVLAEMLSGLGGTVTELEAPFEPEQGAYVGHGHHHGDRNHHGS